MTTPRVDHITAEAEARALSAASETVQTQDVTQPTGRPEPFRPAPMLPGEGTLWVSCRAFRAHQSHHRRDPATGCWRCFLCQPQGADR